MTWAKGYRTKFICDRSGMKFPYREAVKEPGTGLIVHKSESDGPWNPVDHPQNKTADLTENIALRWARPEVAVSVNTSVSADVGGRPLG